MGGSWLIAHASWPRDGPGYRNQAWALQGIQSIVSPREGIRRVRRPAQGGGVLGDHRVFTLEGGFTFADGIAQGVDYYEIWST